MRTTYAAPVFNRAEGTGDATRQPRSLRLKPSCRSVLDWVRRRAPEDGLWILLPIALVVVGIALRTRHFFHEPDTLWLDEAYWALQLQLLPLRTPTIRPIGFTAFARLSTHLFGATEPALRLLPWMAGVAAVIISIPLARRLFRAPGARLLFVAIIALHPHLIDFAREFKPYSVSFCLHALTVLFAVSYWKTGSIRYLFLAPAVATLGVTFAQDLVFIFPGLFLSIGLAAMRARRTKHLWALVATGVATLILLLPLYWFYWRLVGAGGKVSGLQRSWLHDDSLFHVQGSVFTWIANKYVELAALPGWGRRLWQSGDSDWGWLRGELSSLDFEVWAILHTLGLACIAWQKRWCELVLVLGTWFSVFALNLLKLWPLGAFRTDLFLVFYATLGAAAAFDTRAVSRSLFGRLSPTVLLVLLPLALFERDWHRHKETIYDSAFITVMQNAIQAQGAGHGREWMFIDSYFDYVWAYYDRMHPGHRRLVAEFSQRFQVSVSPSFGRSPLELARKQLGKRKQRFWVLTGYPKNVQRFAAGDPPGYRVLERRTIGNSGAMLVSLEPN